MIQPVLFFALGVLCASFIVLLVGPAIVRRAVTMTRRRVEASVPRTLNDIQAAKDSQRAEFAMTARRLEINAKTLTDKVATQMIEIGRGREDLKQVTQERSEKTRLIGELEAQGEALRGEIGQRDEQLQKLRERIGEAEKTLEKRAAELEELGQLYDEASYTSSARQIELVARESEIEKLTGTASSLREKRKEADKRAQDATLENKTTLEVLKMEKKKVADLEKKIERLLSTIADREEMIDRRERELKQTREQLKASTATENRTLLKQPTALPVERESNFAKERLSVERERLEERLTMLTRENKRLKADLAASARSHPAGTSGDEQRGRALLREQMNALAAEVIQLASTLDGPDSPISKALASSGPNAGDKGRSLADRVRALREASSAD